MKKEDRLRKAIKDAITTNISCDDGFYNWKDGGFHGLDDTLTAILKEFEGLEKENKELKKQMEADWLLR